MYVCVCVYIYIYIPLDPSSSCYSLTTIYNRLFIYLGHCFLLKHESL
jgi:hypothetical protein